MDESEHAHQAVGDRYSEWIGRRENVGGSWVTYFEMPCTCSFYDFPHYHSREDTRLSKLRFKAGAAPLTKDDVKKMYEDRW